MKGYLAVVTGAILAVSASITNPVSKFAHPSTSILTMEKGSKHSVGTRSSFGSINKRGHHLINEGSGIIGRRGGEDFEKDTADDLDYGAKADRLSDQIDVTSEDTLTKVTREITSSRYILQPKYIRAGKSVKKGTELRILPVGDSITVGFPNDGDGNGYRGQLQEDLRGDRVVFTGTERAGTMSNGYFAAWSGKTIQYISDHVDYSLDQRPNIILLFAGTNDMNDSYDIATEGNDPEGAAHRLAKLIDKMLRRCPDATILVAIISNRCGDSHQEDRISKFQRLIPDVVETFYRRDKNVLAVDFSGFKTSWLRHNQDCVHPTQEGYKLMGHWWYSFIHQIPETWIKEPR